MSQESHDINHLQSTTLAIAYCSQLLHFARLSIGSKTVLPPVIHGMATSTITAPRRRSARHIKKEAEAQESNGQGTKRIKEEPVSPGAIKRSSMPATPNEKRKRVKLEHNSPVTPASAPRAAIKDAKSPADKAASLQAKKLKAFGAYGNKSPFPDFIHPTAAECRLAHRLLASIHGDRTRPETVIAPTNRAGCGDSASVLDALVRTILSQNTSDRNSTAAKRSMDAVYGGSDRWDAIAQGGQAKLEDSIRCGGLSATKSRVILNILDQVHERYGAYSLDHLFSASNDDAMREMLSFQGVGPKTASCVLLFCLRRESFAVDTHVHRITGLLGWRPAGASREDTQAHLDAVVPDEEKYPLHVLLVTHGKKCDECRAGGRNLGKCVLRKAFRKAKVAGEAGEEVKIEEMEVIKKEEEES